MSGLVPIPLSPLPVEIASAEFRAIADWPFPDQYISRVLRDDIPQRALFGEGRVWVYRDPDGGLVGFGTIDACEDYAAHTQGRRHPYIPLLAVNPTIPSKGFGTSIVRHLIGEAALLAGRGCHDVLFLDVYTSNTRAIGLYTKLDFEVVSPEPIPDPQEGGAPYIVMSRRVSLAPAV
jgi:ribosomal protein S18 acetylase RimI-like enzyme